MAVLNDYVCMAHGEFESRTGKCPHGCSKQMVSLVFRQAPGLLTSFGKGVDKTLRGLANDHGLTNLSNNQGTTGGFVPDPNFMKAQGNLQQEMMLRGQTYASALGDNVGNTLQNNGFVADNALAQVKPLLEAPKVIVHGKYDAKI
jgi:hypothetical protein